MCCRICQFRAAPNIQGLGSTRVSPTKRCCEHAHVYCRHHTCTQGSKFYQGFADQLPLSAYACVLQNGSLVAPKDQGFKGSPDQLLQRTYTWRVERQIEAGLHPRVDMLQGSEPTRCCCKYTHVCCRIMKFHPRVNCSKGLADSLLLRQTHVCCRIHQRRIAAEGLQWFGRPNATEGRHMCVAEQTNSKLLPRRSKVPRFGRPIVALSTHMCAADYVKSRLRPWIKGYKVWPAARTHIARAHVPCRKDQARVAPTDQGLQRFGRATQNVSIQGCNRESKLTTEWQTNCCSEHTHVCCRIN